MKKNDELKKKDSHISTSTALDDEQRVKVLSPTMLVMKRFFRNRLAIVGLCIIIFMFLFSFVGPLFMEYEETQKFYKEEYLYKLYAQGTYVSDVTISTPEGADTLPSSAQRYILPAINKGEDSFEVDGMTYTLEKYSDEFYGVDGMTVFAKVDTLAGNYIFDTELDAATQQAIIDAIEQGETELVYNGESYSVEKNGKNSYNIGTYTEVGFASTISFTTVDGSTPPYTVRYDALKALSGGADTFVVDGVEYRLEEANENSAMLYADGEEYAYVGSFILNAKMADVRISPEFILFVEETLLQMKADGVLETEVTFTEADGTEKSYTIQNDNGQYIVNHEELSLLLDRYADPSKDHIFGTDKDGMDVLVRLMYGGQVSLLIGFIGVFFEIIIGIILGGLAGYFGRWVDTLIMRIVDIFNCIPTYPLLIILGTFMDSMNVGAREKIFMLIIILGLISWPGVARMVRGQILSLREQDFMIAAEASGLKTSSRIFKHLIPNVMPQLIVIATMGLGGLILTESTLSYLGLGVRHPYASWGSIINAVSDMYVMLNCWFMWIPAGMLILLTVLGFNFIGDGLRDAFDPKMKR
ncbi:MAG: ABC transporter permease [Faecousia sp.]